MLWLLDQYLEGICVIENGGMAKRILMDNSFWGDIIKKRKWKGLILEIGESARWRGFLSSALLARQNGRVTGTSCSFSAKAACGGDI